MTNPLNISLLDQLTKLIEKFDLKLLGFNNTEKQAKKEFEELEEKRESYLPAQSTLCDAEDLQSLKIDSIRWIELKTDHRELCLDRDDMSDATKELLMQLNQSMSKDMENKGKAMFEALEEKYKN